MRKEIIMMLSALLLMTTLLWGAADQQNKEPLSGQKVFETYCWGCHHQTAVAFGPPFSEIASRRSADEIRAMITDPANVSKTFGYKRNAMPPFRLSEAELEAITRYILSFRPKGK